MNTYEAAPDFVNFFDTIVWPTEALIDLFLDLEEYSPVDLHIALVERGIDVSEL